MNFLLFSQVYCNLKNCIGNFSNTKACFYMYNNLMHYKMDYILPASFVRNFIFGTWRSNQYGKPP